MRLTLLLILTLTATACSTTSPRVVADKPQYCHTSQDIILKDGENISSATHVQCTDDQIKKLAEARIGLSPYCGEFTYWMQIGGHDVQRKGISCQKPDGSWEIVNTYNN
jgi:hypothetical protein